MEEATLHITPNGIGWIEVVTGCMYSGKTEELIRRMRRAQIARQKIIICKPQVDNRYSKRRIVSHNTQYLSSRMVDKPKQILKLAESAQVVGIDEAQFFPDSIVDVCEQLANKGKRVIVAGLDMDYRGKPFGPMPQLLAIAEYITKTLAICMVCGNPADKTQRLTEQQNLVVVGAKGIYEARCRKCFVPPAE